MYLFKKKFYSLNSAGLCKTSLNPPRFTEMSLASQEK